MMRKYLAIMTAVVWASLLLICPASAQNYGVDQSVSIVPVLQTASYSSGNAMGGLQSVNFFRSDANPTGIFDNFFIASQGGATTTLTIYIFDTQPSATACVDKQAINLATTDVSKLAMAPFTLTPAVVGVGTTVSNAQQNQTISIRNHDTTPTVKVYVCIGAGGSVTPGTTTDLVAKISGVVD